MLCDTLEGWDGPRDWDQLTGLREEGVPASLPPVVGTLVHGGFAQGLLLRDTRVLVPGQSLAALSAGGSVHSECARVCKRLPWGLCPSIGKLLCLRWFGKELPLR